MGCGRPPSTTTRFRTTTRSTRSRRSPAPAARRSSAPDCLYPQSPNPAAWNLFDYGIQRNTWGGNVEFSNKTPWFVRADYNEFTTNGVRPNSGQLGTGSGNGLMEFGAPVDYKTKNTTIEGGYSGRQYGFKLAYINSKFTDANDTLQWTNFYMRSGLDYSLLPPDNELKKWSLNGYVKQLPWDSAILARFTQSKLTNSFGIAATGLKPTGNTPSGQFIPPGVGNLLTQPYDALTNQNLSTFDGDQKKTTVNVAWNASPLPPLDLRVYYDYYDLQNDSTNVSYRQGSQGASCATPPANSATCYTIGALVAPENFQFTKNSAGFDAGWAFNRYNKLLGGFDWQQVDRDLEPAPKTDDYRYWIEYRNTGSWESVTGRLKYEYWQRRSDIDHSQTYNSTGVQPTSVTYYFSPYDVSDFNRHVVKLTLDWNPAPLWSVGLGAIWRQTDYRDNFYGRVDDKSQQYDATLSWGDDKFRVTAIGNWGKVEFQQDYRNVSGTPSDPLPSGPTNSSNFNWSTNNTQDGWMAAVALDWAPADKWTLNASYAYGKTGGGVDFTSANTQGAGGYLGGPLVDYDTDNTTLQRFLIKGTYVVNKSWSVNAGYAYEKYKYSDGQMAGYASFYPYFQNLGQSNISWNTGAFANPGYTTNLFWMTVAYKFDPPLAPAPMKVAEAPRAAPPSPKPPAPPPPPTPAPPPPKPMVQKVTLDSKALFDFDKAVLKPEGKAAIDSQVIGRLAQIQKLEVVLVTGHADPLGSDAHNQKLSERRAEVVRDYLVLKGVPRDKIEAIGMGEKQPVPGLTCDQKNLKERIACLAPDRRVEVEAKGETTK